MDFVDHPKLFIIEYYDSKRNQIDLNCEKAIEKAKDQTEIKDLNELRTSLIEKVKSVKESVLHRYDALESKFIEETLKNDTKQIKDEIFLDQYCMVLDAYERFPLFELKLGFLLFSEYEDHLLIALR